jgi:hypothetical protein
VAATSARPGRFFRLPTSSMPSISPMATADPSGTSDDRRRCDAAASRQGRRELHVDVGAHGVFGRNRTAPPSSAARSHRRGPTPSDT